MVPGLIDTSRLDPGARGRAPADLDGYAACVLRATLQAALDAARAGPLQLVDYQDLPDAVLTSVVPLLALACGAEELDAMKERGRFHGKRGGLHFTGDAVAPEVPATPFCLAAMAEAEQCCRQLEAIRRAHAST
jgi:hypothetical protein